MNAEKNVDAAENSDARAYAIGHLHDVQMGEDIIEYLRGIDATLKPYGGRFIIHGATATVLEGTWAGDMIVIEFPDLDKARTWYESDEYQRILPLRANNSTGAIVLMDGVGSDHVATDILGE